MCFHNRTIAWLPLLSPKCMFVNPNYTNIHACIHVMYQDCTVYNKSESLHLPKQLWKIPSEHTDIYTKLPRIPESLAWMNSHEFLELSHYFHLSIRDTVFSRFSSFFSLSRGLALGTIFSSLSFLFYFSNLSLGLSVMTFSGKTVTLGSRFD